MKYGYKPLTRVIASIGAAAAIALAAPSASAQTTTPPPDSTTSTSTKKPPTNATPQMIQEACQRQKIRTAKLLQFGIPEEFGSEEPFKFDNKAPPC
jgi:hypothetical protein